MIDDSLVVVVILQYKQIANHYAVHLKLYSISIISQFKHIHTHAHAHTEDIKKKTKTDFRPQSSGEGEKINNSKI